MKYLTTSIVIFLSICVLQTFTYSVAVSSNNAAFDEWLAQLDPSIEGEERSALCVDVADGFYPFPGECSSSYYACSSGTQYNLTCANDFVFEPAIGNCVDPTKAPCKTTTTTNTPSTAKTTILPFTCGADGNYPVGNCSPDYYICVAGVLYPQSCPSGVFNAETLTCSTPEAAGCTTTTSTSVTISTTPFSCKDDGNFAAGECLQMYYACIGGVQYNETCPANSVFYNGKCVAPENNPLCPTTTALPTSTTISTAPITTTTAPTTSTAPTTTSIATTTTSTASTTRATSTTSTAPTTTSTAPITSTSQTTTVTTLQTTTTSPATTLAPFKCPEDNGFYPLSPDACSSEYYSCVAGAPYVKVCPAGIFDPLYKRCVLPESASSTCYVPPTTTASTTTTTTAAPVFECPGVGQYPVQGSCTLYYVCTSSGSFVASCPVGQVFNPSSQFCEAPGNVAGCTYYSYIEFYQGMKTVGQRKIKS